MSGVTVQAKCANKSCGLPFTARVADRKRGWGKFCSKACKAVVQEKRTGQHAAYIHGRKREGFYDNQGRYVGFSGANFSNEEHDCNKEGP